MLQHESHIKTQPNCNRYKTIAQCWVSVLKLFTFDDPIPFFTDPQVERIAETDSLKLESSDERNLLQAFAKKFIPSKYTSNNQIWNELIALKAINLQKNNDPYKESLERIMVRNTTLFQNTIVLRNT